MPTPNQLGKPTFTTTEDPGFWQHYYQLVDTVNTLAGHNGEIGLSNHINMGGKRIKGVGAPIDPTDALQTAVAASRFSPDAVIQKIKPGGSSPMVGYRQIGSGSQREPSSSYLNDLMSSVPNANEIFPTITNLGGSVLVSLPSSLFTFADGSTVLLQARTDTLSLPAQYAISSISCVGNLVTVVTSTASGLVAGEVATIEGVTPSQFNLTAVLTSATPPFTLTYQASLGTVTGSGGDVQRNGVYYYAVRKRSTGIFLLGPFSGDTAQNRIQANFDGFQIVAVVVITASGGQVAQSGGGGSPIVGSPAAGSFF